MNKIPLGVIQAVFAVLAIVAGGLMTRSNPVALIPSPTATSINTSQPQTFSNATLPSETPAPYSGPVIRLAWFYKPPDDTETELVARKMDFFILTHKDEQSVSQLKSLGVKTPIAEYLLFMVINDPGDCNKQPPGNQVAYKPGDFCEISQSHPDWFLLDADGNRIVTGENSYFMDPGNEGFRSFWLERARELQESYSWDSIFLDNVEASRAKLLDQSIDLQKYPDDESFQEAVRGFLGYLRNSYFQPRNKLMYANIVSESDDESVWESFLPYLDGVMIESFASDWSGGFPYPPDWQVQMQQAEKALAQGKTLILVGQGKQENLKLETFTLASYLLITNGNAFFRYTNSNSYRDLWLYENYDLDIGQPAGDRYKYQGGWRRDFTKGYVVVKPQNKASEIVINP
jgi:hypothetical protein